jgi:hypothetical protein
METICCNLAALAVANLFYYWRACCVAALAQERIQRTRVAYMLWVMAGQLS